MLCYICTDVLNCTSPHCTLCCTQVRADLGRLVASREKQIFNLSQQLQTTRTEAFFLCFPVDNKDPTSSATNEVDFDPDEPSQEPGLVCVPVLAVASMAVPVPEGGDTTKAMFDSNKFSTKSLCDVSPETESESAAFSVASSTEPLMEIKVLVDWAVLSSPPAETDTKVYPPLSTELYQQWLSIQELCSLGAYIVGLDTRERCHYSVSAGYHWLTSAQIEAAAAAASALTGGKEVKGGKGVPGKDKGKVDVVPGGKGTDSRTAFDPGNLHPDFLRVDVGSLIRVTKKNAVIAAAAAAEAEAEAEAAATVAAQQQVEQEIAAAAAAAAVGGKGAAVTLSENTTGSGLVEGGSATVVSNVPGGAAMNESRNLETLTQLLPAFIPLSVLVHSDLLQDVAQDRVGSEVGLHGESFSLPDDLVVVLQQVQLEGAGGASSAPLVFRVELAKSSLIPITRTSFRLPIRDILTSLTDAELDALAGDDSALGEAGAGSIESAQPTVFRFFWIRVLSKGSFTLTVCSSAELAIGPADSLWSESMALSTVTGAGGDVAVQSTYCTVREGEITASPSGIEQLLFRLPLMPQTRDSSGEGSVTPVMVLVHIQDRSINDRVSLVLVDDRNNSSRTLPHTSNALLQLAGSAGEYDTLPTHSEYSAPTYTLVARVFNSLTHTHAFKWKVIVLSQKNPILVQPAVPSLELPVQRYCGYYTPNNQLLFYRDVFSVDKAYFPLALRFSVDDSFVINSVDSSSSSSSSSSSPQDTVCFVVRIYRASDRAMVAELRARGLAQLYNVTQMAFLSPAAGLYD